jgi:hypothetical protein
MRTLAEIEKVVEALSAGEQRELLNHLMARFGETQAMSRRDVPLIKSGRGFPITKGRAPFTAEDVTRIEGEG